jgi:hypothetical protein
MTFYDGRPRAASACEVGDCGTDRATTANHDARARTHSSYLCQSWLPNSRAALVEGGAFGLDVAFAAGVEILTSSPSVGMLDWRGPLTNVRFTPKSGHWFHVSGCPLCARSRREQMQQKSTS